MLFFKASHPIAILWPTPVLVGQKFVVEPIEMFEAMFPPPVLMHKLLIEPVTANDPVIKAEPENGKPAPLPPGVAFIVTIPIPLGSPRVMLVPATIWVTPPPGAYEADNA